MTTMAWPFTRERSEAPVASDQEPTMILPTHPNDLEADSPTEVFAPEQRLDESVAEGVVEPAAQTDALDEWRRQFDAAHQALQPTSPEPEPLDEQTVWGQVEQHMRAGEVAVVREMVGIAPEAESSPAPAVVEVVVLEEPTPVAEPELPVVDEVRVRLDHHTEQLTQLLGRVQLIEANQQSESARMDAGFQSVVHQVSSLPSTGDVAELTRRLDLVETSVAGESGDPSVAMEAALRALPDNGYKAFALQRWSEVLHASALCRNGDAILKSLGK